MFPGQARALHKIDTAETGETGETGSTGQRRSSSSLFFRK
jgi:hypothetical protein